MTVLSTLKVNVIAMAINSTYRFQWCQRVMRCQAYFSCFWDLSYNAACFIKEVTPRTRIRRSMKSMRMFLKWESSKKKKILMESQDMNTD